MSFSDALLSLCQIETPVSLLLQTPEAMYEKNSVYNTAGC